MLTIYDSSAGSGKTFTLVKEYLRLALGGDAHHYKHILAITFTNKAANEMKSRIVSELQEIVVGTESTMALTLSSELGITFAVLLDRATRLLQNILHHYSDLSVCTIDSFIHRIIRSFAHDLRLSSTFEVEMDGKELLSNAVEKLLSQVKEGEDSQVTRALLDFAENNLQEGKGWNLEYALINFSKELFHEEVYELIDRLNEFTLGDFAKTRDKLYQMKNAYEKSIIKIGEKASALIQDSGLDENAFFQTNKGIYAYFTKKALDPANSDLSPNSYVKKIEENKWTSGKANKDEISKIETIKAPLLVMYQEIQAVRKTESDYILVKLLVKNIFTFMLLTEINRMLEEYKAESNIVHISEFQQRISKIVNEQDAPIIYERLGDWYDNILIDEFQDTSVLQWRNLLPLIENSQTKVQQSLIVGDGKQAIYRFRGGEVQQFTCLPKVYKSDENEMLRAREVSILNYGTERKVLEYNYRSLSEIIDFNNKLYEVIAAQPDFKFHDIYASQFQKSGTQKQGGYVRLDFLDREQGDSATPYLESLCHHVEALIEEIRGRGFDYRDIAILTRGNDTGSQIASFLMNRDIPVVSVESLLIGQSHEVCGLISLLYYLADKDNIIHRTEILYYLAPELVTSSPIELQQRIRGSYLDFEQFISQRLGVLFNSDSFIQNRLLELVSNLIRTFPFLQKDDAFMQFFQDEILEYSVKHGNRITQFLDWWQINKDKKSIIYPDTMNAVKVLTIHKSKGLQYPIVILPDCDYEKKPQKKFLWTEMEEEYVSDTPIIPLPVQIGLRETKYAHLYDLEDNSSILDIVNLLYVATTRPEDSLYITSPRPMNESESMENVGGMLVRFLKQTRIWDGYKTYEWGDRDTPKDNSKIKRAPNEYNYQPVAKGRPINVAAARRSTLLWSEEKVEKINYGSLLHQILAEMRYSEDQTRVINRYLHNGSISKMDGEKITKDVAYILADSTLKEYFARPWIVYNERKLLGADGQLYKPDRVAINKANNVGVVIDFKTGEENENHTTQIEAYATILQRTGLSSVTKVLVYTESLKTILL